MPPPRLIFVTGKGGTGKSTIAAATALALARRRPALLVDLEQRQSAAHLLGLTPPDPSEPPEAKALTGDLTSMTLSPRAELESFGWDGFSVALGSVAGFAWAGTPT